MASMRVGSSCPAHATKSARQGRSQFLRENKAKRNAVRQTHRERRAGTETVNRSPRLKIDVGQPVHEDAHVRIISAGDGRAMQSAGSPLNPPCMSGNPASDAGEYPVVAFPPKFKCAATSFAASELLCKRCAPFV